MKIMTPVFLGLSMLLLTACSGTKKVVGEKQGPMSPEEVEIRQTITDYFDLMKQQKASEAFDYMHPTLFELVPKELLVQGFNELFNDTSMVFSFDSVKVTKVTGPIIHEGTRYARIDYWGYMGMGFGSDEEDDGMATFMLPFLEAQFGEGNVEYNTDTKMFNISNESEMIGIRRVEDTRWYIIENSDEMKGLFQKIVPEAVVEELKL
ncbi:MAG: hypothetical protein AAF502_09660 [Bacteroidota bacterium]